MLRSSCILVLCLWLLSCYEVCVLSATVTKKPTTRPSISPSCAPSKSSHTTSKPTTKPSISSRPTTKPSRTPSYAPSISHTTSKPTIKPTLKPTGVPSNSKPALPTVKPNSPVVHNPTRDPSWKPSQVPTYTHEPSTFKPSNPTHKPTKSSKSPTSYPTTEDEFETGRPTYIEITDVDSVDDDITIYKNKLSSNQIILITVLSIAGIVVLSSGSYFIYTLQYAVKSNNRRESESRPLMDKIKVKESINQSNRQSFGISPLNPI